MISAKPKRPIATVTKPMPSESSATPNENRCRPELTSVPTMPSNRPSTIMPMAFTSEPLASTTAAMRPSTMSEKYSAGPNFSATSASGGANAAISIVANEPAMNEPMAATARALPACPFRAIWYPSMQVTTDDDSPGRLTRMAVVDPPYCAP